MLRPILLRSSLQVEEVGVFGSHGVKRVFILVLNRGLSAEELEHARLLPLATVVQKNTLQILSQFGFDELFLLLELSLRQIEPVLILPPEEVRVQLESDLNHFNCHVPLPDELHLDRLQVLEPLVSQNFPHTDHHNDYRVAAKQDEDERDHRLPDRRLELRLPDQVREEDHVVVDQQEDDLVE